MKHVAKQLAAHGRRGDTELVHMSKGEVRALHGIASLSGRKLTKNPKTGLVEAFNLFDVLPFALNFIFPGMGTLASVGIGALSGAASSAVEGNDPLTGALTGGVMGGIGSALGGAGDVAAQGVTNSAGEIAGQGATALGQGAEAAASAINPETIARSVTNAAPAPSGFQNWLADPLSKTALPWTIGGGAALASLLPMGGLDPSDASNKHPANVAKPAQPRTFTPAPAGYIGGFDPEWKYFSPNPGPYFEGDPNYLGYAAGGPIGYDEGTEPPPLSGPPWSDQAQADPVVLPLWKDRVVLPLDRSKLVAPQPQPDLEQFYQDKINRLYKKRHSKANREKYDYYVNMRDVERAKKTGIRANPSFDPSKLNTQGFDEGGIVAVDPAREAAKLARIEAYKRKIAADAAANEAMFARPKPPPADPSKLTKYKLVSDQVNSEAEPSAFDHMIQTLFGSEQIGGHDLPAAPADVSSPLYQAPRWLYDTIGAPSPEMRDEIDRIQREEAGLVPAGSWADQRAAEYFSGADTKNAENKLSNMKLRWALEKYKNSSPVDPVLTQMEAEARLAAADRAKAINSELNSVPTDGEIVPEQTRYYLTHHLRAEPHSPTMMPGEFVGYASGGAVNPLSDRQAYINSLMTGGRLGGQGSGLDFFRKNTVAPIQMAPRAAFTPTPAANASNVVYASPSITPKLFTPVTGMAGGGLAGMGDGKMAILQQLLGRHMPGAGMGMADDIPAMINGQQPAALSDGEVVIPADVVAHLGDGNSKAGAAQLMGLVADIRKMKTGKRAQPAKLKELLLERTSRTS